ncbi:hypothetical protein OB13_02160 [Pontibacter sp. HJ8]
MKSTLCIASFYLFLSFLVVSCAEEEEAVPSCVQVEVMGTDCESGWYVLRITENEMPQRSKEYVGQLHGGYVTTDNLPLELRTPGRMVEVSLELNGQYSPLCTAVHMLYPAVKVKQVCSGNAGGT